MDRERIEQMFRFIGKLNFSPQYFRDEEIAELRDLALRGLEAQWRAIHLKKVGQYGIEVAVEYNGKWVTVIRERCDGEISHIVEPSGIRKAIDEFWQTAIDKLPPAPGAKEPT